MRPKDGPVYRIRAQTLPLAPVRTRGAHRASLAPGRHRWAASCALGCLPQSLPRAAAGGRTGWTLSVLDQGPAAGHLGGPAVLSICK